MYWLDPQIYAWYTHNSTWHYILDTNVCLENVALQARSPLGKFTENVPSTGINNHKPLKGQPKYNTKIDGNHVFIRGGNFVHKMA